MKQAGWIALNTMVEAFRSKVLYLLGVFSVLLVLASIFFGMLTVGDAERITEDVALAGISVFGMLITVFLGVDMVSREVRERTIYPVLARPLRRHSYLGGKVLGLFATVTINALLMTAVMYAILFFQSGRPRGSLLYAVGLTLVEFLILINLSVLFSTFSTPILSAVLTAMMYVVGHLSWGLKEFSSNPAYAGRAIRLVSRAIYYVIPNLEKLNVRNDVIYGWAPSFDFLATALAYGITYSAAVFVLALVLFERKDIP